MRSADQLSTQILDDLPLGFAVVHAPGRTLLYANRALREFLGRAPEEGLGLQGVPAAHGLHRNDGHPYPTGDLPLSRVLASRAPVVVDDLIAHRPDGRRVSLRCFATPVVAGREVETVILAFTDISEEVAAVEASRRAEERLTLAVDHAPLVLFVIDTDGRFTLSEGAGLATLGLRSGQVVGLSVFDVYRELPTITDNIRRGLRGETVTYTVEVGGRMFDTWLGPVRDRTGAVSGAIGISTDVTESRRALAQTIQTDRVRALGTLAASVAHEINNPLTYLTANLEAAGQQIDRALRVLRETPDDAMGIRTALTSARDLLAPSRIGAERIRLITRDLRTFSRPDDARRAVLDLHQVLRSVLQLVGKEIEARARLEVDLRPAPPVVANEARLVQVFLNLLVNAWQALPEPDPTRHVIAVRCRDDLGRARVDIEDTGRGVDPRTRDRIFEPFVTTKEIGEGTGLGLYVCRNIVGDLGGQLTVSDAPGGGARFTVLLPGSDAASPEVAAAPPPAAARAVRRRVLIVDDDPLVARSLQAMLGEAFETELARDGAEALALVEGGRPFEIVYCDLMMAGMDGIRLHAELGRRAPALLPRLVFMTGGAFTPEAQSFLANVPQPTVEKPFDILQDARRRLGR